MDIGACLLAASNPEIPHQQDLLSLEGERPQVGSPVVLANSLPTSRNMSRAIPVIQLPAEPPDDPHMRDLSRDQSRQSTPEKEPNPCTES